jgi:excisionase family DNA binding protein
LDLPETEAYTIQDAIDVSRVSKTKLYAEIKNGRLKSFLLCGRRLILREDLSAWLRAARDAE